MSTIDVLVRKYEGLARLPWDAREAGPKRVWFVMYDPPQERRLRFRLHDFEEATRSAGHRWKAVDLTNQFASWMANNEYREAYFEQPEDMDLALEDFAEWLSEGRAGDARPQQHLGHARHLQPRGAHAAPRGGRSDGCPSKLKFREMSLRRSLLSVGSYVRLPSTSRAYASAY